MEVKGVTVKQAATALGVSTRTIFRYLKSGKLEARKIQPRYQRDVWMIDPLSVAALKEKESDDRSKG